VGGLWEGHVPLSDCNNMTRPLTCNTRAMHTHTHTHTRNVSVPNGPRAEIHSVSTFDRSHGNGAVVVHSVHRRVGIWKESAKTSTHHTRCAHSQAGPLTGPLTSTVCTCVEKCLSRADPERATQGNRPRWGVMNRAGTEVVCGRALVENAGRFVSG
jgi:hypothetical protein